ncbi:hypothetical protein DWUX_1635 [Desulfovibrio diazotrophicus]|nr:hypothetical protein DWUX_1635 [Desulfovibrio diazotrophicus]
MGLLILFLIFCKFNKETVFPGKNALFPIFATVFIIWAGPQSWLNRKILSHKILVWFGLISYPLYLWHWPILAYGRIIYGEMPPPEFRFLAVAVSILLSWLTVKIIERPFRFGNTNVPLKLATLCLLVFGVGGVGLFASKMDFETTHTYKKLPIKQKKFEFAIGNSLTWYKGKSDWLFLGNTYDRTVEKLMGAITPTEDEIRATNNPFLDLAKVGEKTNTKIVLIVGPDKNSVYSEFLPDDFVPSPKRYSSHFLDQLNNVPSLTVYNPTEDILRLKKTEGILYWKTDTHWNNKGAFLVYSGFSKLLGLPIPQVKFQHNGTHSGDLIHISKQVNFPLHAEDNWEVVWGNKPEWVEKEIPGGQVDDITGKQTIVTNQKPLSNKKIWVVGDSFTAALKQYLNATFRQIRYMGHWRHTLKDLASELEKTKDKPDIIVVVRVERSF